MSHHCRLFSLSAPFFFFFFNDTATTEIYTLSLHDALPICDRRALVAARDSRAGLGRPPLRRDRAQHGRPARQDRKSTRLNSSHLVISYAVFCLKKKKLLEHLLVRSLSITVPRQTLLTIHST